MKRKSLFVFILLVIVLASCSALSKHEFDKKWKIETNAQDTKIIVDADVMYVNDDVFAIFELLKADELGYVDFLGITAAGGNTLAIASAYDTLNQLEYVGRTDIPVYLGYDIPLDGLKDINILQKQIGTMGYVGSYEYMDGYTRDIKKVKQLGLSYSKLPDPVNMPQTDMDAVDFIIKTVHQYPGKVTIVALAGLTNIAKALIKDPSIANDAAGIFYMGGVFDVNGEVLPKVEINWWYDPVAVNTVLSAGWKKQITVSHDSSLTCFKGYDMYMMFKNKNMTPYTNLFVQELAPIYENGKEEDLKNCWDPMVPACLLCPSLIENKDIREVWVDTREGKTYGSTFGWRPGTGPEGTYPIEVVFKVNRNAFWDFLTDIYSVK